jgi:hypothetical protein
VAFVGQIHEQIFLAHHCLPRNLIEKRRLSIFYGMFGAKLGIKLPTQLKLLITSAIASGLLVHGTGSILR